MKNKLMHFFVSFMVVVMMIAIPVSGEFVSADVAGMGVFTAQAAKKTKINKSTLHLEVGKTYKLKIIGKNGKSVSYKKIKWKSSNKKIATVSSKGVVKGIKKGNVLITGTYNKKKYTCKLAVNRIGLTETSKTLGVGKTFTLKLKDIYGKNISAKKIKWTTNAPAVATVSKNGVVKAVKKGSAKITAEYKGKKYTCKVKSVIVGFKYKKVSLYAGETVMQYFYDDKGEIPADTYWAGGGSCANVNETEGGARVYGEKPGTGEGFCIVRENYESSRYYFDIEVKLPTIEIQQETVTLKDGETFKLTAKTMPQNKLIEWSSSNENIATVSQDGVVTPLRHGSCEITAKYQYGNYSKDFVETKCNVICEFEGGDYRKPLDARSGKVLTFQAYDTWPQYKIKVDITEVIRGSRANDIAYNENFCNETVEGYEWCFIFADLEHISNSEGTQTVLEASSVFFKEIYTDEGYAVSISDRATLGDKLGGLSIYDVKIYSGAVGKIAYGILIPKSTKGLLLRVPNLDSSTWVKIENTKPDVEDSVTNEQLDKAQENFDKLKSYMLLNGEVKADGATRVLSGDLNYEGAYYTGFLSYNVENNNIWFGLSTSSRTKFNNTLNFTMNDAVSPVKITADLYDGLNTYICGDTLGEATVYPAYITNPAYVEFLWKTVYEDEKSIGGVRNISGSNGNIMSSNLLDKGIMLWNKLISGSGLTMTDIGFVSY